MKIAVIGCGVMGSAFAKFLSSKHQMLVCDRNREKAQSLAEQIGGLQKNDPAEAAKDAECIFLAIKPKDFPLLSHEIRNVVENKVIISILAGVSKAELKGKFPKSHVIRTMPNLGFLCQKGVVGIADDEEIPKEIKSAIDSLFQNLGLKIWMEETQLEAITALSGSGIGFIFALIEAMIEGGVYLGFPAKDSREIVLKTMEGAIALMRETGMHPAELKLQICSPGGTTIAGLKALEESGVRSGIMNALVTCYQKAVSMHQH